MLSRTECLESRRRGSISTHADLQPALTSAEHTTTEVQPHDEQAVANLCRGIRDNTKCGAVYWCVVDRKSQIVTSIGRLPAIGELSLVSEDRGLCACAKAEGQQNVERGMRNAECNRHPREGWPRLDGDFFILDSEF